MTAMTTRPLAPADAAATTPPGRVDGIDFWRGLVLCTIFINHVPGNVFENLTPRNFGFSDSAEAFVFISGVAIALAYGRRFQANAVGVVLAMKRRAVKLYATHLALSFAGLGVFLVGAAIFDDAGLMDVHGRDLVQEAPWEAVVGIVSLGHQLGYFNILPMYVLLVALVPFLLWLDRFGHGAMLGASLAVYVGTKAIGLNIPTWPMRGTWFLDPFAWQFLMAIGLAVGFELARPRRAPNRWLAATCGLVVVAGLVCTTDAFGFRPGLYDDARQVLDLDKTMLGTGRLVHFLCLAYLVAALDVTRLARRLPIFAPLRRIGRHGLALFAILSLLAAVGQVVTEGLGHSLAVDSTVVGVGLVLIYAVAVGLETPTRVLRQPWALLHARR